MNKALKILNSMRELELKNGLSTVATDAAIAEIKEENKINGHLLIKLNDANIKISEFEEAMKPKTCDGCKFLNGVICKHDRGLYCVRQFEEDYFQPKDNA